MIRARPLRNATINMRTTLREKDFLQKAAEIAGFSNLTNFIMTVARREAVKVLNETEITYLSERDWKTVGDLMENPPEPNERLRALLSKKD